MLKLTFKKALRSKNIRQNNTERTRRDGIKANFHICPSKINSITGMVQVREKKKKREEIQCLNVNQINSSEERYNTATRKKGMKSARRRESKKNRIIS